MSNRTSATRICKKCGQEDRPRHHRECLRYRTRNLIERITGILNADPNLLRIIKEESQSFLDQSGLSWEELVSFEHLHMSEVGLVWCKRSFELYDSKQDVVEKKTILSNIMLILCCYVYNSYLDRFGENCPYCGKSTDDYECQEVLVETAIPIILKVLTTLGFPRKIIERVKKCSDVSHLHVRLLDQFLIPVLNGEQLAKVTQQQLGFLIEVIFQ